MAVPLWRKYLPIALAQSDEWLLMVGAVAGYVILYDEQVEANIP